KELSAIGEPDPTFLNPALSSDARRIAVQRTVQLNPLNSDICLMDVIRGGSTRFTFDPANDGSPIWSPDGNRIAFSSNRKGTFDLYVKASNGTGNEEVLLESPHIKVPLDWSPDGRFIVYFDVDPKAQRDIWVLPMTGDRKPFVLVNTP